MNSRSLSLLSLVLAFASAAFAQQPSADRPAPVVSRAEVLVLGVYHMANPGQDIFNLRVDDVLAPKRQAEISQLIDVLKEFRPTKIAVEADVWDRNIVQRYADYVAGHDELSRNEIEQIGFRLAKELGHKTVYPVDVDGDYPFPRVVDYAKATGRSKELDAIMVVEGAKVAAQNQYLTSHTVLEMLLSMNADDSVAAADAFYYRLVHFGEPGDWAGADLLSEWFRRNARIYSNVARLVDSPNERILVIFGAGHLAWLRRNVASDPALQLRKLAEFVK